MQVLAAGPAPQASGGPIGQVIAAVIGNYMTSFFVLGLIVAAFQILRIRGRRDGVVVSGILLNNFILFGIGCAQVFNFVMHSVFGDFAAQTIGWAPSPFQLELAFSSLGVGVMAFMLYGRKSQLRAKAAIVIATVIFGFGAAGGHIYQELVNHDYAANNSGWLLVSDVLLNAVGLALLIWHAVGTRHRADVTDAAVTAGNRPARQVTTAR